MDTAKLRYYIEIRGKTISSYGAALGVSKTALYRKMRKETEFTREEIQKTMKYLELSDNETIEIFFTPKVSKKNQLISAAV